MKSCHISLNIVHSSCRLTISKHHSHIHFEFCHLNSPHIYKPTLNHLHPYTLQMPKQMIPSQSAMPHHLSYTLNTIPKRLYKSSLRFLSCNYTPHSSHHHTLRPFQTTDFQLSTPMFQSRMSTHIGHKLCISTILKYLLVFSKYNSMHAGSLIGK